MSRNMKIMPDECNKKYQLKEFLMETIGQILLVAFFVGKSLTPHCWAKLCSHLRFGLNQLNLLKKILWECDISRRDKNDDGMLTGDEVKKVNTPMMHRYMYELYMYTQNIL